MGDGWWFSAGHRLEPRMFCKDGGSVCGRVVSNAWFAGEVRGFGRPSALSGPQTGASNVLQREGG